MYNKELAIRLMSYCESLKDGDSMSKKQIDKLFEMVDQLVDLYLENYVEEDEDADFSGMPLTSKSNKKTFPHMMEGDDLPF